MSCYGNGWHLCDVFIIVVAFVDSTILILALLGDDCFLTILSLLVSSSES
jgi:hypothetical protein